MLSPVRTCEQERYALHDCWHVPCNTLSNESHCKMHEKGVIRGLCFARTLVACATMRDPALALMSRRRLLTVLSTTNVRHSTHRRLSRGAWRTALAQR